MENAVPCDGFFIPLAVLEASAGQKKLKTVQHREEQPRRTHKNGMKFTEEIVDDP